MPVRFIWPLLLLVAVVAGCDAPDTPVAQAQAPKQDAATETAVPPARQAGEAPSLATRKAGIDWPTFLGQGLDSKSPETGILTKWPAAGPKLVWQRPLGTSYGMPTISRGRLFQFDRFDDSARVYCLNAETGEELWKFEYPSSYEDLYGYNNGPRCSPVVDGDRVYSYGAEGMLHCLNAADGQLVWKLDTMREFGVIQNFFGVGSTPVIEGDLLIAMVGGSPPESQLLPPGQLDRVVGNGSGVVAFDKMTGEVKYKLSDELASYASLKLATIGSRRWCFAFCRGGLVGFEPTKGQVDFEYPWRATIIESVNASMPVVAGNQVFISECYGPGSSLLEVSPGSHKVVWKDDPRKRDKAMQTHWNTPVHLDGYLYGSSGRHENADLRCIEWKTGKVQWSQPGLSRTSLMYIDGHFLSLGEYGTLQLLKVNPEKYELVAEADLGLKYPCWAAPIVSHGLLYVRGDGRLVCMELIPAN